MSAAERAAPDVIRSVERVGSETTVTLCGELDVSTSPAVRDVLEEECARRPSVLKLDLVDVDFVDSSALHTFVIANKQLEPHGGVLRIVGVSEFIRRTFEITQLDRIFLPHANGNGNGRTARP
jgi:anti-sigma B factor antagonist